MQHIVSSSRQYAAAAHTGSTWAKISRMCGLQILVKPCYMNHNCAYIPTHHLICDSDILGAVRLQAVDSPDAVATQVWRNYCLALKPFLLLLKNPNRPQEILWHFLNYKSMERIADTPPSIICPLVSTKILLI